MMNKNVPGWERGARGVLGAVTALGGLWWAVAGEPLWGTVVALSGASLLATAVTGWCPMCAMVGRTLPKVDKVISIERL